ncbi:hypothetical protein [Halopelagius fulvigenes]|uniref:Uncharacterized protein n=1 Tax=Halopelagius fulvigenes TaxID=1198324 RepID=A0ABD5U6A2_9EURY
MFLVLFGWEYLRSVESWRSPLAVAVLFLLITLAIDGARRKLNE